jgi:hypothetical protein
LQYKLLGFLIPSFEDGWIFKPRRCERKGQKLPRNDPFAKWELIVIRLTALVLLVIAAVQLVAPQIIRLIREIIGWFQ